MLAVLLDPASTSEEQMNALRSDTLADVDFLFVGGSGLEQPIDNFVLQLKKQTQTPIVLFPGSLQQFTPCADALLFLSLLSGRNPEMLIENQIRAARAVHESKIDTVPMGYILIDGGKTSAVEQVSGTTAISATDINTIIDTALAGQLLGMQLIYLEAGSGARTPVAPATIKQVRAAIDIPLIVGGGICTIEQMQDAYAAGADIVVIGNHFEAHPKDIPLFAQHKTTLYD